MKQTAVEWLVDKLMKGEFINSTDELIEQAKQMEKDQLIDAHIEGQRVFDKHPHTQWTTDQAELYYYENYGR